MAWFSVFAAFGPRRRLWMLCGPLALAVLLLAEGAAAAPPPNDNFVDAAVISGLPVEATGSNVEATREPGEPNHGGQNGQNSVWFKWTAPANVAVTATSGGCAPPFQDSVLLDPVVAVYTRTDLFGLVPVAGLRQPFRATAGEVYWIAVDSGRSLVPPSDPTLDPDICVRLLPAPSNDDFSGAMELVGFPVSVTRSAPSYQLPGNEGNATSEPGEPDHGAGLGSSGASLWYRWTAPADGPVWLRACWPDGGGNLAVYTGDRVDALTRVAIGQSTEFGCGVEFGTSLLLRVSKGQVYRIAVAAGSFELLMGTQAAVVATHRGVFFSYRTFSGQADNIKVSLSGDGPERTLLLEAPGVSAANGCHADTATGGLRCPIPGRAPPALDVDLGDGNDTADIRVLGRTRPRLEGRVLFQVLGGAGDDRLLGSVGFGGRVTWYGQLRLLGGPGADRLRGLSGFDYLEGGPGADILAGGTGNDSILGGGGPDRLDAGPGRDSADGGSGNDRIRTVDGSIDSIACWDGGDLARLDGIDLANRCERRILSSRARAVATHAVLSNDDGDDFDHLEVTVACPVDVKGGCRGRLTAIGPGKPRRIRSLRLRLAPGKSDVMDFYSLGTDDVLKRGVRVTVVTRPRRGRTLKFTDRLPVGDVRYEGE
jgi:RTX calcium-binding nonapeptide repeat (4 copies)